MPKKDYKSLILSLFQDKNSTSFQKAKKELRKLIQKTLRVYFSPEVERLLRKHYKNDYMEELFQETLVKIFFSKRTLLRLPFISEGYLLTLIKNVIYFCLSAKCRALKYEISFEEVKEKWKERFKDSEEIEKVKAEEIVAHISFDYLKEIKAEEWLEILVKILTPKDRDTLCHYLFRIFEGETKEKGSAVLYKRWERLKKKIKKNLGKELEGEEEIFKETLKKFFKRICQKRAKK